MAVRVSVCVPVELWVSVPLPTLVAGSVRVPVDTLVEPVPTAVWVSVLLPVPLPVLLFVVIPVEVVRAVEVSLAGTQSLAIWQAWLSAQTPELGHALFMTSRGGKDTSVGMGRPPQLSVPRQARTDLQT